MTRCMMLGEIIGLVDAAFAPINEKLSLSNAIANPIEAHVDGFGASLLDGIVSDTTCSAIVGLDGRCRLDMSQFFECNPHGTNFFGVMKNAGNFGFSCTGDNFFH